MAGRSSIRWTVKELSQLIRKRQFNEFDANIGVSGARGDGKSTFLYKIFNSFKQRGFKPIKHQVYSQRDVIDLLANQHFSFCWDDEAINSGYKREFGKVGQIQLIKTVTNYRDNFNIYGSALPFFYNLDRALRELIFMHVHIIERGLGVIFLPLEGQIHSQDPWDSVTNKKIEQKENARLIKNPTAKFRFHKFTTFSGFVYFGPMTEKQKQKYLDIKEMKRKAEFKDIQKDRPKTHAQKLYAYLTDGKLSKQILMDSCYMEGVKYSSMVMTLNKMMKDHAIVDKTLNDLLLPPEGGKLSKTLEQIKNLVPDIPV